MAIAYSEDYLLNGKVKILQPLDGYRASIDAVLLAAAADLRTTGPKILDVGSGTGAVSLCLAHRLQNKKAEITGIDIQEELVELANLSATANGFANLRYICADIRKSSKDLPISPNTFDAVISNPPYGYHDMPSPNKSKAYAHNLDDYNLERWLAFCLKMTKPFGKIYIINRAEALPQICASLHDKAGAIEVLPLYSKSQQTAKRVIIAAQKTSKSPGRILPGFVLHGEDGNYTENTEKILRGGLSFADVINI